MKIGDKRSTLKFLNFYLLLFSIIMIGLVSFYARLIYYYRGFTNSPGFMKGDIFIGGVLVFQIVIQLFYTKKQLVSK